MRPKTSGSEPPAVGGGCSSGGLGGVGFRGAGSASVHQVELEAPTSAVPGLPSPFAVGRGEKGSAPPPDRGCPSSTEPPPSARGSRTCASWVWIRQAPMPRRGRYLASRVLLCTSVPPGGLSSGGPGRLGGPALAKRILRPPLRASPHGPAPGVLARPAEGPVLPWWPTRQQRLMPQPTLLHLAHDGAPCSKQSSPCVPLPSPGGRMRAGRFWAAPILVAYGHMSPYCSFYIIFIPCFLASVGLKITCVPQVHLHALKTRHYACSLPGTCTCKGLDVPSHNAC